MESVIYILTIIGIPLLSPAVLGLIRKMKALMQSRHGASIFQPYLDLAKLFQKNEVISEDASWIFTFAPYIVFGSTLAIAWGIPLLGTVAALPATGDFLVFVYLIALGTFFLALAGMDTGGGFGGFGSSREMTFAALTEGGLIFSLAGVALMTGASTFAGMMSALQAAPLFAYLPLSLSGAAFFLALLSENARYPVDNPATHLELTMVHEAMILEYSGKRLALMEWAAGNKLLMFIVIFANIFVPWSPAALGTSAVAALVVLFAKITIIAGTIALIESTMSKFRFFRVPDLLFTSFVLGVISIVIIVL